MTREEAYKLKETMGMKGATLTYVMFERIIDKIYDDFEQRNAELEQRIKELQESKYPERDCSITYPDNSYVMFNGKPCIVTGVGNKPKEN